MGFSAETTQALLDSPPPMWFIAQADPAGEDARAAEAIRQAECVVVTSLFMTETARRADIILPGQSFAEREGTFTNGMRRVQRFYTAQDRWATRCRIGPSSRTLAASWAATSRASRPGL